MKENQPKRVHIIGVKNSGKTTLVVELVRYLTSQGYRVATIKHTHHHHELDTPGKDSHRHREAGAEAVGIVSPGMTALFWPTPPGGQGADPYERLMPVLGDCDLVLVEGHLHTTASRIEVWRAVAERPPIVAADPAISALITDDPVDVPVPIWSRSDLAGIAAGILEIAGRTRS